ncbi:hypothetical protein [Phytomonospora endophytica]|uniref:Uncharacterized protein n=1 Tax=Phytomonospora endophytica TaxID=714109 RepID=A0A841FWM0_9ACTN|nr:hypothetical protein [Phytomonospora endophytica]MBB6037737.1 hypothetical protein [Phytomonospora endophytica]GIG67736.1 hypothetical protein Pen01_40310 [Phytomonospora endophytica]
MTEVLRHVSVAIPKESMTWIREAASRDGVTVTEWVAQISADEVAVAQRDRQRRLLGDDDSHEVLNLVLGESVAEDLKQAALSAGVTISDWVAKAIRGQAGTAQIRSMFTPRQRSDFENHISSVLHDARIEARRAEQTVYGRVLAEAMSSVAKGLPRLRWNSDPLSAVLGIHGIVDTGGAADRYRALRAWVERFGGHGPDVTVEYREAVVLRAAINVEGQRCLLIASIWDPNDDTGPRPQLRDVRAAANPHLAAPTVNELIEQFTKITQGRYSERLHKHEADELSAEINERVSELNDRDQKSWRVLYGQPANDSATGAGSGVG